MLNKLVVRRTLKDQWAQCLHCLAGETLPMYLGELDGLIQSKGGRVIFYGKFKQVNGRIWHNCGEGIWRLCERIPRER